MINTRSGMVSVFDELVIEERPWYVAYEEGAEIPADPTGEPVFSIAPVAMVIEDVVAVEETVEEEVEDESSDKPKRKNWKDVLADKAKELEGENNGASEQAE